MNTLEGKYIQIKENCLSYERQELPAFRGRMGSPPGFGGVRIVVLVFCVVFFVSIVFVL